MSEKKYILSPYIFKCCRNELDDITIYCSSKPRITLFDSTFMEPSFYVPVALCNDDIEMSAVVIRLANNNKRLSDILYSIEDDRVINPKDIMDDNYNLNDAYVSHKCLAIIACNKLREKIAWYINGNDNVYKNIKVKNDRGRYVIEMKLE